MLEVLEKAQAAAQQADWPLLNQYLQQFSAAVKTTPEAGGDEQTVVGLKQVLDLAIAALATGDFQSRWDLAKVFPTLAAAVGQIGQSVDGLIAPLIEIVQDDAADVELRWFAIRILGQFNHPAVIKILVQLLQTEDIEAEELSEIAATTLASFGPDAIAALTELLADEQSRGLAVQALAQIRSRETIAPLCSVVDDPQVEVRSTAIEALSSFHDPQIAPILANALNDVAATVRREAVAGLALRADLAPDLDVVALLRDRLWDFNLAVCQQAATSLGRLGTPAAAAALWQVLQSAATPAVLQLEAVRALGWMQHSEALNYLHQALQLESLEVYQAVLTALGRVEAPELKPQAAEILLAALASQHPVVQQPHTQQAIALGLGQLGELAAVEPLIQLLATPDIGVQLHAIAALKQLAPEITHQKLQTLAADPAASPELKQGVAIALQEWQMNEIADSN
ncbi:HEAT repeat domain-containing protein [Trichocoleus sp. FACHB-262]|uniref:HEAT repeat domain-containing protein n=1 Tax=Trichocoleus sp. FACHB-262 TaxID=2692869 RepID=UPI0016856350|nr:HEAT repeat domain-containing protein [Trichocoleus sp. FACHB-262]MBD2122555.1 HEAT repeat domain-containing protein [Trichocoleus sp. FACHB-262]